MQTKWFDPAKILPNTNRKVAILVRVWYMVDKYRDIPSVGELHTCESTGLKTVGDVFPDRGWLYDLGFLNGNIIGWGEIKTR